jgi:hypothetical protein
MTVGNSVDAAIPMSGKMAAPIDPTENAMKAYSLAGTMVDTQEKMRKQEEGQFDRKALQEFLQGGGDLSTPEGTNKALGDLKGKVSSDFYGNLIKHKDAIDDHVLKQRSMINGLRADALEDMSKQDDALAPMLDSLKQKYDSTAASKGKQAADAEFAQNRGQLAQWMQQQQVAGQARFTPDVLQHVQNMPPEQLGNTQAAAKYHAEQVKSRLAEVKADALQGAGDLFRDKVGAVYKVNKTTGATMKQNEIGEWEPAALPPDAKPAGKATAQGGIEFSPDALNMASTDFLLTHREMTRATPEQKVAIRNNAAKMQKMAGLSDSDVLAGQVTREGMAKAQKNLGALAGATDAFENTLIKNVNTSLSHIDEANASDIPILNKWVQKGMGTTQGLPPAVAKLAIDLRNVASEYAKLSSGSLGNTQIGEKALLEISDMFSTADNPDTLRARLSEVLVDAKNRTKGIRESQDAITSRLMDQGNALKPRGGSGDARVSAADQKSRDSDRTSIMRDELKKSMAALNDAKTPEEKARIQSDIKAIRREMGGDAPAEAPAPTDDKAAFDAKTKMYMDKYGPKK